jgi:hypothetical protein
VRKVKIIILTFFIIPGCSSIKNLRNESRNNINEKKLLERTIHNNLFNSDFYIQKAKLTIENENERRQLLATLKFKYPGNCMLSIKTISGIEIARAVIQGDSIFLNDRLNRTIYRTDDCYINKKYGFEKKFMPLITGDMILNDDITEKKRNECKNGLTTLISEKDNLNIYFEVDCGKAKIVTAKYLKDGKEKFSFTFREFRKFNENIFPVEINIDLHEKNTRMRIHIRKIDFGQVENIEFIPGKHYKKVIIK